jgi:hypothetical protein
MKIFTVAKFGLALLLVVMLDVCSAATKPDNRLDGKWTGVLDGVEVEFRFKNGNYVSFVSGVFEGKGTYTTDNGTITMDQTHVFGSVYNTHFANMGLRNVNFESRWYLSNEFIIELRSILLKSGLDTKQIDVLISALMAMPPAPYNVDEKNLIIAFKINIGSEKMDRVLILTKK